MRWVGGHGVQSILPRQMLIGPMEVLEWRCDVAKGINTVAIQLPRA